MTNSLKDLLGDYHLNEPPEIQRIKAAILEKFNVTVQVGISGDQLVVTVPNAALAGALRMQSHQLCQENNVKQRLTIRIAQERPRAQ